MTTITLQIDESTAKGQALLAFIKAYHPEVKISNNSLQPTQRDVLDEVPKTRKIKESNPKFHKTKDETGEDIFYDASVWEEID
jgi:hypothetical protein